jgi:hypothetical protein
LLRLLETLAPAPPPPPPDPELLLLELVAVVVVAAAAAVSVAEDAVVVSAVAVVLDEERTEETAGVNTVAVDEAVEIGVICMPLPHFPGGRVRVSICIDRQRATGHYFRCIETRQLVVCLTDCIHFPRSILGKGNARGPVVPSENKCND